MQYRRAYNPFNPYDPYDPYDPFSPYGPYNSYSLMNPYNPSLAQATSDSWLPSQPRIEEHRTLIYSTGDSRIVSQSHVSHITEFGSSQSSSEAPLVPVKEEFPDGGMRAWLVVMGSFCVTFGTFGFINSWGVFQDYYGKFILVDFSPATIAWIGSTQLALAFFPGLMVGRLFELGYFRIPQVIASTVLGIGIGVACGFLFGPALAVVSHWFQKRRGLALGIMASGASVGGTAIPITVQKLIPLVGFQWSIRVIGFIELIVLGISILTLRRRLPCGKVSGGLLNSNSFSHIPYLLYVMAVTVSFLGLYTVLTYLQRYGVEEAHLSPQFAMYLIPIANSASLIGRVGSGHVVDKLGPLNTLIPSTLLAGATTFIWPLARTKGTLIAVSCVYGIAYGTLAGMLPAPVAKMSSVKEAGPRTGMLMTIAAFGALVGVPISGDILAKTNSYVAVGAYAGSLIMICVVLLIAAKCLVSKQLFSRS